MTTPLFALFQEASPGGFVLMADCLLDYWKKDHSYSLFLNALASPGGRLAVHGLEGTAAAFFAAALVYNTGRSLLLLVADQAAAERWHGDLQAFSPEETLLLPGRELFMNPRVYSSSNEGAEERVLFLRRHRGGEKRIFIATASAALPRVLPPEEWLKLTLTIKVGSRLPHSDLIYGLVGGGYRRTALTEAVGHFSVRGAVIDFFPPGSTAPCRAEFLDDTVVSLRQFDPHSQRSQQQLSTAEVFPALELLLPPERYDKGAAAIRESLERSLHNLNRRGEAATATRLEEQVERHLELLSQPGGLDMLSAYYPFFYEKSVPFAAYAGDDTLVLLEEPASFLKAASDLREEINRYLTNAAMEGELLFPGENILAYGPEALASLTGSLVELSLFPGGDGISRARKSFSFQAKSTPYYHGQWETFRSDYKAWFDSRQDVFWAAADETRARGVRELVLGLSTKEEAVQGGEEYAPGMLLAPAPGSGIMLPDLSLVVVTEENLLPHRKKRRSLGRSRARGVRLSDYRELTPGDFVVHEWHGIGRYEGLSTLEIQGVKKDYLLIKYRGSDKLYVPADQVGLVEKYSSGDLPAPRLHSLNSGEWQRTKNKVNRSVEELAGELLTLYAARQAVEGYAYGPDHPWQQDFEAYFPFEETPDQLRAINEVKADMEARPPMDRLVCGDVGYGKTEVAMRAAFKAVMEGKQVAILVPTTVLAQQHFQTFSERFAPFPVKIAQLSRFVPPARQKEIVRDLAAGNTDIVIATHRLLSGDVNFKDLGLLVVDEEQRFGVKQKERIRQIRLEVDTLALSATPIPRTLHLSLAGARDLSVIDTPPEERYPIQTYVLEYSESLVREVVQRELARDGQVYIVFNRTAGINAFAARIRSFFPHAAVAVGHGQMSEANLEQVMLDFQAGKYQVLVCTTIIESGLDIANVNTLLVLDADRFGLAQLYQLRGRVGRSSRLAYAYLTYARDRIINEASRRRLKAIREFTELGSGFKVALQDLEIRGAGSILGAEQHGFIAAVGFDLYMSLLNRAVSSLKQEKHPSFHHCRLDLPVDAYLPAAYISDQVSKIDFYQRIYRASSPAELEEVNLELTDRFGPLPEPARELLDLGELRVAAGRLGITRIWQVKDLRLQFARDSVVSYPDLLKIAARFRSGVQADKGDLPTLRLERRLGDDFSLVDLISFIKGVFPGVFKEESCPGMSSLSCSS